MPSSSHELLRQLLRMCSRSFYRYSVKSPKITAGNAYERRSSSLRCHSVCDGSRRASSAPQR